MELLREYQKDIMSIEESKKELKNGATAQCKKIIDETYSKISETKMELEIELYKRKSCLLNDIKANSSLMYDMMMSIIGALIGVIIGFPIQRMIQPVIRTVADIIEGQSVLQSLGEISLDEVLMELFITGLIIMGIGCYVLDKKEDIKKKDDLYVFQVDMGNYEIQKIDELLEKM